MAGGLLVQVMSSAASSQTETLRFPVPSIPLSPGDVITNDVLVDRALVANAVAQKAYVIDRDAIIGKIARRALAAGAAIPLSAVREPFVFQEGQRVIIDYTDGSLSIQGAGIALQPGAVGQTVRIRNIETGVIVTGVVLPSGGVSVGGR